MPPALVQSNTGISATGTTNPAFSGATTTGNLVVLGIAADDYNASPDAGWTQSTGMETMGFHGGYIWWRISAGETSFTYTIGSATGSVWVLSEWSGVDASPYDISNGQFANTTGTSQATPSIIPTVGGRLLVAEVGTSVLQPATGVPNTFTNSFTFVNGTRDPVASGTRDATGQAYRLVTGDGSTGYTTTGSWTTTAGARSGLIIAFKEAAAPWPPGGSADAAEKLRVVQSNLTVR